MKNVSSQAIADVFSKVSQAIRRLDEAEMESLIAGDFRVELVLGSQGHRQDKKKNLVKLDVDKQKTISEVAQLLENLDNREQGLELLDQRIPNKDLLTLLARHLDEPVSKRDTVERLREKIIEATIGYRLRSRAIRGTDSLEKAAS